MYMFENFNVYRLGRNSLNTHTNTLKLYYSDKQTKEDKILNMVIFLVRKYTYEYILVRRLLM